MQTQVSALSTKQTNLIIILILGLYTLVGMTIDLIAPSLPAMSQQLNISSGLTKNVITFYLLGYAFGNFCIGFLSDALGRRRLLLAGLFVFVLASLWPIYFPHITILFAARFLQGFSIAAFAVVARAILVDILPGPRLMHVATMIATMWGIGPVIGPVIGGYLQYYFNWQACFYFFGGFGLLGLITMFVTLPETHFNRQALNLKQITSNFKTIISHQIFLGSVIIMGLTYSLLIVFNTLGPFLIQTELGKTSVYFGHIALFMGLSFLIGTFICRKLIKHFKPEEIFVYAIHIFILIAFISLILAYLDPNNLWLINIASLLMFLACGIIYPVGIAKGLALFRHLAGSGSAVMNLINVLITSVTAFLMGYINAVNFIPIAWIYFILILGCGLIFILFIRPSPMSSGQHN